MLSKALWVVLAVIWLAKPMAAQVTVAADEIRLGDESRQQQITGDQWIMANAYWDGTNWQRVDIAKTAFALDLRGTSNFPGEAVQGAALWVASPAANPINPTFGVVGGWELGWDITANREFVIGGYSMEVDGHGTVPYGRVFHNTWDATEQTGIGSNLFADFSGRDEAATPSWWFGRIDDSWKLRRLPGTVAITNANFVDFLTVTSAGNATFAGGTVTFPTPFTLGATSVTTTGTQLNYLNAATGTTGTTSTNVVFSTSPALVTPTLGVATATRLGIGAAADGTLEALLSGTAPGFQMTDTTALAKSLRWVTDANVSSFYEAAGAAGQILSLDLANNRVGIGTAAPDALLHVSGGELLLDNQRFIYQKNAAGTQVQIFGVDSNSDLTVGRGNLNTVNNNDGRLIMVAGTGKEFRWLNASASILAFLQESTGFFSIGTGAGKSKLHVEGASGWFVQDEQNTNPALTDLDANDSIAVYNKANTFVIAYNNAGVMTYLTIPLDGSTTAWTHGTVAP